MVLFTLTYVRLHPKCRCSSRFCYVPPIDILLRIKPRRLINHLPCFTLLWLLEILLSSYMYATQVKVVVIYTKMYEKHRFFYFLSFLS